jgi:hypothetical protein
MTLEDARKHLNRVREGYPMPVSLTTEALYATGDIPRIPNESLCFDGNEPQNNRAIEVESQGTESRFSYSAYLDSQQTKGVKE